MAYKLKLYKLHVRQNACDFEHWKSHTCVLRTEIPTYVHIRIFLEMWTIYTHTLYVCVYYMCMCIIYICVRVLYMWVSECYICECIIWIYMNYSILEAQSVALSWQWQQQQWKKAWVILGYGSDSSSSSIAHKQSGTWAVAVKKMQNTHLLDTGINAYKQSDDTGQVSHWSLCIQFPLLPSMTFWPLPSLSF